MGWARAQKPTGGAFTDPISSAVPGPHAPPGGVAVAARAVTQAPRTSPTMKRAITRRLDLTLIASLPLFK